MRPGMRSPLAIKGTRTVKVRLGYHQVRAILAGNENRLGFRYLRLDEKIARQIVKQAKNLFPEIEEMDKQRQLAWKIQGEASACPEVKAIVEKYGPKLAKLIGKQVKLREKEGMLVNEKEEKIEAIINQKFDEAGINIFRAGTGYASLRIVAGPEASQK